MDLAWATASEQNSKEFIVERSLDGRQFAEIGFVSASGNSNQTNNYTYVDNNATSLKENFLYYRLKQVDLDGEYRYSIVLSIPIQQINQDLIVNAYPNPFSQTITLQLVNVTGSKLTDKVELYLMDGTLLYQRRLANRHGGTILLDDLPTLSEGTYLLKTVVNGKSFTNKIIH